MIEMNLEDMKNYAGGLHKGGIAGMARNPWECPVSQAAQKKYGRPCAVGGGRINFVDPYASYAEGAELDPQVNTLVSFIDFAQVDEPVTKEILERKIQDVEAHYA